MSETLSQDAPARPASQTDSRSGATAGPETISVLLVGSDAQNSGILQLLRKYEAIGFEVHSVQEPDAASPALEERGFDAVLVDDTIESERRLELLKSIASAPDSPAVVVLCGSGEGDVAERARSAGASEAVRKDSTDYLTLGRTIHKALLSHHREDGGDPSSREASGLTIFDALTGVHNNDFFLEALERECIRANRYGTLFSVLMLDIDDFDAYTDRYKREACDDLVKSVGELLKRGVRQADVVSRGQADRFSLLLPETDFDGAMCLGERLRFEVAARRLVPSNRAEPITISVGVCSPANIENLRGEYVTVRCEDALRQAKEKGTNTVVGRRMRPLRPADEAEVGPTPYGAPSESS